jgi:hypothetical protein
MIDGNQYVSLKGSTGRIVPRDGSPAAPGAVLPPAPKLLMFVLDRQGNTAGHNRQPIGIMSLFIFSRPRSVEAF